MKKIIDLHQDLMLCVSHPELYKGATQTSCEKIKENNVKVVIASTIPFSQTGGIFDDTINDLIEKEILRYNEYCQKNPEFIIIKNKKDLYTVINTEGLFGLIIHIEGLNIFNEITGWEMLEKWYGLGLRSIGPIRKYENPFGGEIRDADIGLTPLGEKLIKWCEAKGVIVDFAHMNAKTFLDASKVVTKPIIVSHGNSSSLCEDLRNYTDDQLKYVAKTNGIIGFFLSKNYLTKEASATLETVKDHIRHMVSIMGPEHIGIGTDYGGIRFGSPEGMDSIDSIPRFIDSLDFIDQDLIGYKNALRVIKEHLQ